MTFKNIGDVVKKVMNNIYATSSEIKKAIEFLSIAKATREYTGMDIISMISTLEWRLSVIDSTRRIKSKQMYN